MPSENNIQDLIKLNAAAASAVLTSADPAFKEINYLVGPALEIIRQLIMMQKNAARKNKKYPLLALIQPYTEKKNPRIGISADVTISIVVATLTQREYKPEQRDEKTFPTLWKIVEEFIRQIPLSNYYQINYELAYDITKYPMWGEAGTYGPQGNVFEDNLDAIIISNLKLSINEKIC